ncbi:MAG: hypothetical protein KC910_00375 [Candidatus Eremiobacteraeota bacterium]|nr:hypothetical protein [Candidatus Eremiobacteraeota bacterium]
MQLQVVGVRHHSPACARLTEEVIRQTRPAVVLIEGPADMNDRLDEFLLGHELPIALFSYHHAEPFSSSCWAPFCDYSPEWRALVAGREVGAEVRFMDLPGWSRCFWERRNRFADGDRFRADFSAELCRRLNLDGPDALWDHLFELDDQHLGERLDSYFAKLRSADEESPEDHDREQFMAACVAWAMQQGGPVVVVCGGFHKPYLEVAWKAHSGEWPELPPSPGRRGSYLVPYSFRRLDSFVGYESGMPSPAYYQAVWEEGLEGAADHLLRLVSQRLRARKQPVSAADLVAAMTMARGLMQLRGHPVMARCDLLDGLASALLKQAQDTPLPWTGRERLQAGTDPVVVEVLAALSGERVGRLAETTPQPPLVADAFARLAEAGLKLPGEVTLRLEQDGQASQVLHRLTVLEVDGFERVFGPAGGVEADLSERWSLAELPTTRTDLIEAAAYGGTLEDAARARLEELLRASQDSQALVALVSKAYFCGLFDFERRVLDLLSDRLAVESSLARLGAGLAALIDLWRYGGGRFLAFIEAMHERGLWLLETFSGAGSGQDGELVVAVAALRDGVLHLGLPSQPLEGVLTRKQHDQQAPPALRGACLGGLWSLGRADAREAAAAVRRSALPEVLGDFLAGLFGLAREQVVGQSGLVAVIDELVRGLSRHDFFVALPALRLAFTYFPPRQRDQLARLVLGLHGAEGQNLTGRLQVVPADLARGLEAEARLIEMLQRFGLAEPG